MQLQEDESYKLCDTDDSDASEPDVSTGNKIVVARTGEVIESWPPAEIDSNNLQPVTVPIGPKSIHMRRILANQVRKLSVSSFLSNFNYYYFFFFLFLANFSKPKK